MSLEDIEQKTLSYLKQVSNPLVPISRLTRHLDDQGALGSIERPDLLRFLRNHELFRVMEPPGLAEDPAMRETIESVGFNAEPYVVLDTRVPSQKDVAENLNEQLLQMADALIAAVKEAREKDQMDRARQIEHVLNRLTAIRKRLQDLT